MEEHKTHLPLSESLFGSEHMAVADPKTLTALVMSVNCGVHYIIVAVIHRDITRYDAFHHGRPSRETSHV